MGRYITLLFLVLTTSISLSNGQEHLTGVQYSDNEELQEFYSQFLKHNNTSIFSTSDFLYFVADSYFDRNKLESAFLYYRAALELYEKKQQFKECGNCHINLGILNEIFGDLQNASEHYHKALLCYFNSHYYKGIADALNNIGIVYSMQGNYERGLEYFLLSLELEEKMNNPRGIAYSLNNLGLLSRKLGRTEEALEYYNQSLDIKFALKDIQGAALTMGNIGSLYEDMDSLEKALIYFSGAVELGHKANNPEIIATNLHNSGGIKMKQAEIQEAIVFFFAALELRTALNHIQGMATTHLALARCFLDINDFNHSIFHLTQSVRYSNTAELSELLAENYQTLSEYYFKTGDYKKAYEFSNKYNLLNDSLNSVKNQDFVAELQTKYETTRKEQVLTEQKLEIETLNKDKEIQTLTIQRNKFIGLFLMIILVLILLIAIMTYKRLRFKSRINQTLSQKNKQLEELNSTKNKLFSIISHDMKNLASVTQSLSGMLKRRHQEMDISARSHSIATLNDAADKNKELIDNLLNWALTQGEKINLQPEVMKTTDLIEGVTSQLKEVAGTKSIRFSVSDNSSKAIIGDRNMLTTVLRNLCSNAIKFSDPGSEIQIRAENTDHHIAINIEDTGIGMTQEEVDKLFLQNTNMKEIGNHKEKGTGFGLLICKEFVILNKGRIFVTSEPGKGSIFTFTIPAY